MKVIGGLYKGVSTVELDNLAAETAASMTTQHPDYAILAARIAVSNLHKKTGKVRFSLNCLAVHHTVSRCPIQVFSEVMEKLYNFHHPHTGEHSPMISKETYEIIMKNAEVRYLHNTSFFERFDAYSTCRRQIRGVCAIEGMCRSLRYNTSRSALKRYFNLRADLLLRANGVDEI